MLAGDRVIPSISVSFASGVQFRKAIFISSPQLSPPKIALLLIHDYDNNA